MYMLGFLKTIYQLSENWIKSEDTNFGDQQQYYWALLRTLLPALSIFFLFYFPQISMV